MEEDFFLSFCDSNPLINNLFDKYSIFQQYLEYFDFFNINDIKNKEFIKNLIINNKTNPQIKLIFEQYLNRSKSKYYDIYLQKILDLKNPQDLIELFYDLISKKLINCFLSIIIEPNLFNPNINTIYFNFEKLILNHKEYYLLREYKQLRNIYIKYIKHITNNLVNPFNIIYFEIKLAKLFNNHKQFIKYNKNEILNNPLLKKFLEFSNLHKIDINEIIIDNYEILSFINSNIINNFQTIKEYILFSYINLNYKYISEINEENKFNYLDKYILGTDKLIPDWIRAINYLENYFGDILGYYYGINLDYSSNIINFTYIENLILEAKNFVNTWKNNENKNRILKKLDFIKFKFGYPLIKYDIDINLSDDFFFNHINLNFYFFINNLKLYNKPKINYWKILPYQSNALYSPIDNEITIPISLFYIDIDILYFIISHEIVHCFDENGIKYDYNGNYNNNYYLNEDFYLKIKSTINNKYLNEIIADIIGLKISFNVYKKYNFNKHKDFFIKYASIFKYHKYNTLKKELIDIHPPNHFRVNFSINFLQHL